MAVDTATYVWRIEQGEAESMTFPVTIGGAAMDIAGWPVDVKMKVNPGGPTLYTLPSDLIDVAPNGDGGSNVTLRVPPSVSLAWTFTLAWYRVKITDPDSPVDDPLSYRVMHGHVIVDPE